MINLTAITRLMPMSGAGNGWQTGLARRPCIGAGEVSDPPHNLGVSPPGERPQRRGSQDL